eukprot:CAMPEP_0194077234 /NCGR_PEP_ID=MMETSP0149-20130528/3876_1 /TAXON_ID=122233 /ORGANISM="Chaetoceros debilis, Strain MM31A-1" /LENGTH=742 /DNA_ID=CAMNT_0038758181 /DNA_START=160 /DNA_END=2388 /DNA_ORIENTATION=-
MMMTVALSSLASLLLLATNVDASPPFVLPEDTSMINQKVMSSMTGSIVGSGVGSSSGSSPLKPLPSSGISRKNSPGAAGRPIRVAYQGESGAYSEKSLRELLGENVIAVARPDFESCYRAVASRECDYACLPVENSLGGSIHDNYDLMLRYDLVIVAEHECRISHFLHANHGVKKEDIKYCMSHPQALAQCDNYLRSLRITPVPMYDTAGSVKLLMENGKGSKLGRKPDRQLPDKCTPANTAAIASVLAGKIYNMKCLDKSIEDDDSNFTRFLLLGRGDSGVSQYLNKNIPSKTSIVFTLPNTPGALYKALACFSLREIDFSKIESRPTSASLLNYLKFKNEQLGKKARNQAENRFRYCFYLDFLESELEDNAQNALHHLKEQADYCRILGSYPQKSKLVGPVKEQVEESKLYKVKDINDVTMDKLPSDDGGVKLNVGIIGYGKFGQFLGQKFVKKHNVKCVDTSDKSKEAEETGAEFYPMFELESFLKESDVLVIAVPMIDFESTVSSLPKDLIKNKLIVEVCPLGARPKAILLEQLPPNADIISSNAMFGPNTSGAMSWDGQPYIYEKVRVRDELRADAFLDVFERARCQMVKMTAEQHDAHIADAEFVTHLAGRLLGSGNILPPTPVSSKEYAALCDVTDMTSCDTFELFYGMYNFNPRAKGLIAKLRENLAKVERQLAAKEAYLAAKAEFENMDRQRLIADCRQLLHEVAKSKGSPLVEEAPNSPVLTITDASDKSSL